MRVLIVHPGVFVYGGAELLIVKLANYLTKNGVRNSFLTTAILPAMEKELKGTDVIVCTRRAPRLFPVLQEARSLYKGVKDVFSNFDVINVHNFPAELSVFGVRKPVIWMCNEPPEISLGAEAPWFSISNLKRKALLTLDAFLVKRYVKYAIVSDTYNAQRFSGLYRIQPKVINYGVDFEFFKNGNKEKILKKYDLAPNDFVALQVGMLTPYKNQLESVKAVETVKGRIPNIKLVLAGFGQNEYSRMLEQYVKDKGLEKYVFFIGHVDRAEVRDLFAACNVVLHPIKSQGGWLAPFEALCAKKIIVVSPELTCANIIQNEDIGTVTTDLARTVEEIYFAPKHFELKAEKGCNWVKDNLNWDKFCSGMLETFKEALQ
ncbi:MAG: glycosyltransferase family 4 protein [Candidatus Omnitrophota bacterium]